MFKVLLLLQWCIIFAICIIIYSLRSSIIQFRIHNIVFVRTRQPDFYWQFYVISDFPNRIIHFSFHLYSCNQFLYHFIVKKKVTSWRQTFRLFFFIFIWLTVFGDLFFFGKYFSISSPSIFSIMYTLNAMPCNIKFVTETHMYINFGHVVTTSSLLWLHFTAFGELWDTWTDVDGMFYKMERILDFTLRHVSETCKLIHKKDGLSKVYHRKEIPHKKVFYFISSKHEIVSFTFMV